MQPVRKGDGTVTNLSLSAIAVIVLVSYLMLVFVRMPRRGGGYTCECGAANYFNADTREVTCHNCGRIEKI